MEQATRCDSSLLALLGTVLRHWASCWPDLEEEMKSQLSLVLWEEVKEQNALRASGMRPAVLWGHFPAVLKAFQRKGTAKSGLLTPAYMTTHTHTRTLMCMN